MQINIAARLKPYSHTPGIYLLLPGSQLRFQLFPALLRVYSLTHAEPTFLTEIALDIQGPMEGFTAMQNLEQGYISIWGHTAHGYMRYRINALNHMSHAFAITVEKSPYPTNIWSCTGKYRLHAHSEQLIACPINEITDYSLFTAVVEERLSLGMHKAQDWTYLHKRADLAEIFPIWHRLAQMIQSPEFPLNKLEGTSALLLPCQAAIERKQVNAILPAFRQLWLASFDEGLSPRLTDTQYQGFQLPPLSPDSHLSPCHILTQGAMLFRQLFLQEEANTLHILPALPSEFHCGRLTQAQCRELGTLDLEWSKKLARRMVFHPLVKKSISLHFQKEIKRFRLRRGAQDSGRMLNSPANIDIEPGMSLWFDRFEK